MIRSVKTVERFYLPPVNQDSGAAPDATALPLGIDSTSAIGAVTATGDGLIAVAGVSSTSAVGDVIAGVAATVTATGLDSVSAIGTATATGAALTTPAGLASTSAIGTVVAGVSALTAVSGIASASAIGSTTEIGNALISPAGVQTTAAVGATTSGPPEDVLINQGSGRLRRPYRIHDAAFVTGVSSRSAIGQAIAHGDARVRVTGRSSRSALGTATAAVVVPLATPPSVSAFGNVQAVAVYRQAADPFRPAERPATARPAVPATTARVGYSTASVPTWTPDEADLLALLDEVAA